MKIAINTRHGGRFRLSWLAFGRLQEIGVEEPQALPRNDMRLVQVIEELGRDANHYVSCLKIVEIPDSVDWEITEDSGAETIRERHRFWK